ncbi:hypothetical protein OsI_08893 [Oryza sativa Indica Group]|uniref:non-specific serine/threonine protein kinase n=1 Tax=Oryza sativa subsp. indica TaxID=39946 RepID=B8AIE5_ORYSI|nr:hypothetical protein OsI_08893 [Oryza sativa Indica Group]
MSSSSSDVISGGNIAVAIVSVITGGIVVIVVAILIYKCCKLRMWRKYGLSPPELPASQPPRPRSDDDRAVAALTTTTVDVIKERPVRFSSPQLREMTGDYAERLGAGGFGVVYKGQIPGGLAVAVKVLGSDMGRRAEEQFMAEIGTIGRTSHVNLVMLYGFCFDADLKALVYECMPKGSLERYLFFLDEQEQGLGFHKLFRIAVGTAKAIRYLHDECARRIIHYDIKPGNVLLDEELEPKVGDFGLARLCDRDKTHLTMTGGGRGTPGYAAPELWKLVPVTHKCDVYSYGMLLFEILGYMHGMESQEQWYPRWVWQRLEHGETEAVVARARAQGGAAAADKAERMCTVALWCVQYRPEDRPSMASVVQMLEAHDHVAAPTVSPFAHLDPQVIITTSSSSSLLHTDDTTGGTTSTHISHHIT